MRLFLPLKKRFLLLVIISVAFIGYSQAQTYSTPGTTVWTAPAGVTSVSVETWGGGGKGGSKSSTFVSGGGGGGAYAKKISIPVTPGSSYDIVVGAGSTTNGVSGGDSYFINNTTVMAKGGDSPAMNAIPGASGGAASTSVGDAGTVFSGGNGANGSPDTTSGNSGGGGASGRLGFNGANATNNNGAVSPAGGGSGGAGRSSSNGNGSVGANPGGGGGGGFRASGSTRNGGNGGNGKVVITYTCPTYLLTAPATTITPMCANSGTTVTLRSSSMPAGSYIVTYNLTGATAAIGNTASMVFTAGAPGTGTFSTSALSVGSTNITITRITSANCTNTITSNNTATVSAIAAPTASAGAGISTCATVGALNITSGSAASNYTSVTWTTSGSGTFTNSNSLLLCTYTPSAADITAGSVLLTLTAGSVACVNATSSKTLTIIPGAVAVAGTNITACMSATAINITAGASASNYSSVLWTSSGTGTLANSDSLTICTYSPSGADTIAGSVTLTLKATGLAPCSDVTATKTLTFDPNPGANAGTAITICASSADVNITTGASASDYTSLMWSSNGSGTFTNSTSISDCTYNPSAADKASGSVTLTLTASSAGCTDGVSTKILTIVPIPSAIAGPDATICASTSNITIGSSASSYSSIVWTTSGTGTLTNANSLTNCSYTASAADITAGSVLITLTGIANAPCNDVISTKTLTIIPGAVAVAGTNITACMSATAINITAGASASNYSSVLWTSSGTGTFANSDSLTICTYSPSAADTIAGSVTLTLKATGLAPCSDVTATKTLTFDPNPGANAGTAITICASSADVNITTGASASNYTSLMWSSNGSGTFTNSTSISDCTYNPSAADKASGSVTLTLTASSAGCTDGVSTKILTIVPIPYAIAGPDATICATGSYNITVGSSAGNYSSIVWTTSGTGTLANANSLTACSYLASAADITAGNVIITLTAIGNTPCSNAVSTKILTLNTPTTAEAGTAITTCSTSGAVNITAGSMATAYTSILWTSSGTGTFANAFSLTTCTYTPSAADTTAGSVTLTLTASNAGCGSDTSIKNLTIYATPNITGTTPASRTGSGTLILGATGSAGTLYWYAVETGGASLGFGTSFTTPNISVTTTFYVEAVNGNCSSSPRTPVVATVNYPEIDVRGNATSIADGDITPVVADWTNFGTTNMTRTFTIYNTGAGVLNLGAITFTGVNSGEFTVTTPPSNNIAAGSNTTFVVTFNPTAVGTRAATLAIATNDTDENPYDFSIQGTGVAKEIDIRGNAVTIVDGDSTPNTADWTDFSTVTATRTYTIRNTGNIILNVGAITLTGINASDFAVTTLPSATIGANGTTTFTVTFTPSAIMNRIATISIANNDSNENPYDFAIQGFGVIPEIDITGNAVSIVDGSTTPAVGDWTDFGSTAVTHTFTIQNTGNTLLDLGAITFAGANPTEFSVTTPPSATVAAFSSTTFVVTFTPAAVGLRSAVISIVNNDNNENPYDFTIQGMGVEQEIDVLGNAISIVSGDTTPATADWTDFGSAALTRTFTIKNSGNLPLTLGAIAFTGTNPGDFSITTPPVSPVPAFATTTFVVSFNQGGIGNRTATMNIVNDDSTENPYNFAVAGFGGLPEINIKSQYGVNIVDGDTTPSSTDQTDFGNVSMDGGTVYINLIIENTGSAALSIGNVTFTGTNAADFAILLPPAATIASGGNSRFRISFSPTTIGAKTAMFSIANNDSNENPYNFSLAGLGVQTYKDTDADGVTDNRDIDDDNDGIIDTKEQSDGLAYPLTGLVQYTFLNETFGAGTTKGLININTPGATCTYCYEDRYGSICNAAVTLEDGEYCVNYKITGATAGDPENIHGDLAWYDGLDHTPLDTNGRMAIFNASFAAGTFYETRIDGVIPNVPISYSFWALNIMRQGNFTGSILPNITVEFRDLSNNLLSSFTTGNIGRCSTASSSDNTCGQSNWLQYSTSVNLGNVTSFIVRFRNNSTGGGGNDLALDDINITQNYIDTDGDGVANIFDLDDENDGIPDVEEAGFKNFSSGLSRMDLSTSATWVDVNTNGMHDTIDAAISGVTYLIPDTDGDLVPNYLDLDSDNDSAFDVDEAGIYNGDGDINGDGKGDLWDTDRDGILDLYDNNTSFGTAVRAFAQDSDLNGLPDNLQLDSDNNGAYDIMNGLFANLDSNNDGKIDGSGDSDKDGITDTFDTNTSVVGSPRDLNRKLFLDFDGRNDYGQGAAVLGGLSTVTMMAWINLNNGFTSDGTIVGQDKFQLKVNAARKLEISMNGSTTVCDTILASARWYHVGVTLGGGSLKLYLNGKNVSTVSVGSGIAVDGSLLTIGRNPIASSQFFKGKIDEIRVFNRALTDDQFQRMVYQEIQNTASQVRGFIVPKDVGSLPWANLLRYYRMDAYKDDIIDDLTTASIDAGSGMKIYNHKNIYVQQAPMPFITERTGSFAVAVNSPTKEIRGMDIMDQHWSIVEVKHNITQTANNVDLGMLVDPGITIVANNDIKIQNDWYLLLDGKIDLQGRSQLVQTINSDLAASSSGSLERDQQGQSNLFNYNYWCSPVGTLSSVTNNNSYTVNGVMRDGTNPANLQNFNWTTGYNASPTTPVTLSSYWIYKFQNTSPVYANWSSVGPNGTLLAAQGFTLKGSGAATPTQNFAFVGKPNNGTITTAIAANNLNLSGNPYASALDSDAFLTANLSSTTGALYFWEHFSTNSSHTLLQYQGGYAVRNLVGGIPPVSPSGISGLGSSARVPGRFVPVGQGFFINGSATGGTITFDNAQRLFVREDNAASNIMFRQDQGPRPANPSQFNNAEDTYAENSFGKIRIGFNSVNNFHRQILIGFMNEFATSAIDVGYDAPHIDIQPNDMYFMNNADKLTIQGDGFFNENNVYPLGVKTAAEGMVTFTLDATADFDDDREIYIYDNNTQVYHDIRTGPFDISLAAGTLNDRFSLRFKTDSALATNNFNAENNEISVAFTNDDNMITILNNIPDSTVESVKLFNIIGQSVSTWDVKNEEQSKIVIPVKELSTGTYIIKVHTTTGDVTKKVIIK